MLTFATIGVFLDPERAPMTVCLSCGRVREPDGSWHSRPRASRRATSPEVATICPACAAGLHPDVRLGLIP